MKGRTLCIALALRAASGTQQTLIKNLLEWMNEVSDMLSTCHVLTQLILRSMH